MTETTPQVTPNAITFEQMLDIAKELGRQAGLGKDVQIKSDLKVIEAAYHGSMDLTHDKHGTGVDDATAFAEAYFKASGENTMFDAKADNQRRLISNVRKCIKLGSYTKGGNGEPMQTVNALMTYRQKLRQDPAKRKNIDDAHNTLMKFATQQLKRDNMIDPKEFDAFCYKAVTEPRTAEDIIEGVRSTLTKLSEGKVTNCPDMDNSPEIKEAMRSLTKRLANIAKAKGGQTTAP